MLKLTDPLLTRAESKAISVFRLRTAISAALISFPSLNLRHPKSFANKGLLPGVLTPRFSRSFAF